MTGIKEKLLHNQLTPVALSLYGVCAANKLTTCSVCPSYHLLGFPLSAWGVALYTSTALLFALGLNKVLKALLAVAFASHLVLLAWGMEHGIFCPTCFQLAGLTGILAVFAHIVVDSFSGYKKIARTALVVLALAAIIIPTTNNPGKASEAAFAQETIEAPSQVPSTAGEHGQEVQNLQHKPEAGQKTTHKLTVYDRGGSAHDIDLDKNQVLFFAWWCSHCNEALDKVSGMAEKPVLVSTYFKNDGRDYEETDKKLAAHGLSGTEVYYLPQDPPVKHVPALLTTVEGAVKEIKF